jgi:hypothetical protein
MPNWVYNTLRIYGPRAGIQRFLDTVKTKDSRFDFNAVIPKDDGEAWSDPWGTYPIDDKDLDVHEIVNLGRDETDDKFSVKLWFETQWRPPIPVIFEASTQFKELEFHLQYAEEGGGSAGEYRAEGGCDDVHVDTSALNAWDFQRAYSCKHRVKTPTNEN